MRICKKKKNYDILKLKIYIYIDFDNIKFLEEYFKFPQCTKLIEIPFEKFQ